MTDERLRQLERVWQQSGSPEDETTWLIERTRSGERLDWDSYSRLAELNAEGFGTLTPQSSYDQQIRGSGAWRQGRWRVVMVRPLKTDSSQDHQFAPGETVPVAFAVWDGSQRDRNGQKAVSVWQ